MAVRELMETPGWAVMHQYFRIDRGRWRGFSDQVRRDGLRELQDWLVRASAEEGLQLVPIAPLAKADFAVMAVHPEPSRLQQLTQELNATLFGTCLVPVYAFLSISEVNEYMTTPGDWARHLVDEEHVDPGSPDFRSRMEGFQKRMAAYAEARVHPRLPSDLPVVCFYPMRKARGELHNWYTLDFAQRKQLMGGHAETGRRFAGRVVQLVTSATGLDDWEWGVTLFARDLKSIRDAVYEMRFDRASAVYGQFGPFYVGLRFDPQAVGPTLHL